jgi:hypothetical protein
MAYPAIRSTNTGKATSVSSIACTHPAGLAEGDLLVLFVGKMTEGSDRTISTPSGWTKQESITSSNDNRQDLACFKKVATAGDVSAGSTTVSFSGTVDSTTYGVYAITGAASGLEINKSEANRVERSSGATSSNVTFETALTPTVTESLVLVSYYSSSAFDPDEVVTASGYTLTPTTSLTEQIDNGDYVGGSRSRSLHCASGQYSGTTQVTSRSVTLGGNTSLTSQWIQGIILFVNSPQNATGTNELHQTSPVTFSPLTGSTQGATNALHEATPTIHSASARGENNRWSNDERSTNSWTNESL